jgi:hypothetical protein
MRTGSVCCIVPGEVVGYAFALPNGKITSGFWGIPFGLFSNEGDSSVEEWVREILIDVSLYGFHSQWKAKHRALRDGQFNGDVLATVMFFTSEMGGRFSYERLQMPQAPSDQVFSEARRLFPAQHAAHCNQVEALLILSAVLERERHK